MLGLAVILAGGIALGVFLLFIGLGRIIESGESVQDRIDTLAPPPAIEYANVEPSQQDKKSSRLARLLNRLIPGQTLASRMATELARANVPLTVAEYLMMHIAAAIVLFLVTLAFLQQPVLALLSAIVGAFLPRVYLRRRQAKRLVAFQAQLVDVLALLVGALRSGYGMTIAMDTVAKQMPPPASEEFARVVREIGLGVPSTRALSNLARRVRSDDLDLIVTAISIQHEVGGNLAAILDTISDTIRARIRLEAQLRVLTAQQRIQRIILSVMPFALGVVIYLLNPEYMLGLFTPGPTLVIPIAAVTLIALGYVLMGKLGRIEI